MHKDLTAHPLHKLATKEEVVTPTYSLQNIAGRSSSMSPPPPPPPHITAKKLTSCLSAQNPGSDQAAGLPGALLPPIPHVAEEECLRELPC